MTVTVYYYVTFGSGDGSDSYDYEVELTPKEEEVWLRCQEEDLDPNEELRGVLSRAYDEIMEQEQENFAEMEDELEEDGYTLEVFFP